MIIDLAMLTLIGIIVEIIAMFVIPTLLPNAFPLYCVSLLICSVAVMRWGIKASPVIFIMAAASVLSGKIICHLSSIEAINENEGFYDWRLLITNMIGFSSSFIWILYKKVCKKKETLSSRVVVEFVTAVVMAVCYLLQVLTFSVVTFTSPSNYFGAFIINMMPAVLVTMIFILALRRQGSMVDAKTDLVDKKKEAELEEQYYKKLRKDIIDRSDEDDSSKK